jgi:YfiH family protein
MKTPHGDHNREAFVRNQLGGVPLILADVAHGQRIQQVVAQSAEVICGTDALVTADKGIFIAVTGADCYPVYFFDPEAEVVGVAHGSWRTIAGNIVPRTIERMEFLGADAKRIKAAIGPGICHKCYEFGPEAKEIFAQFFGAMTPRYRGNGTYSVDLSMIIEMQLIRAGIRRENLEIMGICTACRSEEFFSARKDRKSPVEAGLAIIGMPGRKEMPLAA